MPRPPLFETSGRRLAPLEQPATLYFRRAQVGQQPVELAPPEVEVLERAGTAVHGCTPVPPIVRIAVSNVLETRSNVAHKSCLLSLSQESRRHLGRQPCGLREQAEPAGLDA